MAAFAPPCGRGTRGRHFTGFQYHPPGRQPFGLKVKSPRAFGPAPLPEGGPWGDRPPARPGAQKAAWNRPRNQWRARLPGPSGCPALRRTAHSFTRGGAEAWNRPRNQWRAKPEPPCTACRLRGVQGPPWSIFGHFLLIKKVATRGLGFCLTVSQTSASPMAQGKTSPDLRCDRSENRDEPCEAKERRTT